MKRIKITPEIKKKILSCMKELGINEKELAERCEKAEKLLYPKNKKDKNWLQRIRRILE